MKRYLPQLASFLCFLLGLSAGWFFGYTRPALRMQHLYDETRRLAGISDKEMLRMLPEGLAAMKRDDESAARVSLAAIGMLDRGEADRAAKYLAYQIGSYYRVYRNNGGDTNLIELIERATATSPALATELSKEIGQ